MVFFPMPWNDLTGLNYQQHFWIRAYCLLRTLLKMRVRVLEMVAYKKTLYSIFVHTTTTIPRAPEGLCFTFAWNRTNQDPQCTGYLRSQLQWQFLLEITDRDHWENHKNHQKGVTHDKASTCCFDKAWQYDWAGGIWCMMLHRSVYMHLAKKVLY